MLVFGLAGTNGAGKDSIGDALVELGFKFISGSDMLRDELRSRGVHIERKNLASLSAEWRREHGFGVVVDKAIERYRDNASSEQKGLVIASLRHPGEVERVFEEQDGHVIWVDADPMIRYERITSRLRTDEDNKTYEEFIAEEQREMKPSGDAATLNMGAVKEKADIFIENNGNDIEAFKEQVKKQLEKYL